MKTTKYQLLFLCFIYSLSIQAQESFEKVEGYIYLKGGSQEPIQVFDEENKLLQKEVFVEKKNGEVTKYLPKELEGFSFIYQKDKELLYESKNINGKQYFVQRLANGYYPLYEWIDEKGKIKHYTEYAAKGDSIMMVWIRDKHSLNEFLKRHDFPSTPSKQKAGKKTIMEAFRNISIREKVSFESFERPLSNYVGLQALYTNNIRIFEFNFTQKKYNNFKNINWHSKLFYYRYDNPRENLRDFDLLDQRERITIASGVLVVFSPSRFRPYAFAGLGLNFLSDNDEGNQSTYLNLTLRLGLEYFIKENISITAEAVGFIPTLGLKIRLPEVTTP